MNPTEIDDRSFKERFLIIITVFVTIMGIGFAVKSCGDDVPVCGPNDEPRPTEHHQCIEGKWVERAPDRLVPFDGPKIKN